MGKRNSSKERSGAYTLKHKELCQAKYIKGTNGNDIRAKLKERVKYI